MLPDALIVRAYVGRGMRIWLGVRLLASAVMALAGEDPLALTFGMSLTIVLASLGAALAETARRREWVLLGNLGIAPPVVAAMLALPALAGELAVSLVAGLVR